VKERERESLVFVKKSKLSTKRTVLHIRQEVSCHSLSLYLPVLHSARRKNEGRKEVYYNNATLCIWKRVTEVCSMQVALDYCRDAVYVYALRQWQWHSS
jgi:hypothetical protein